MSRNGSGTYDPVVTGGAYPAVSGTLIESAKFNTLIADVASALSESLAKDGQTTPTANLPMGGYTLTGLGNGTTRSSSVSLAQLQDSTVHWCGTAGGTANALTLSPTPAITAYAAGQVFRFKAGASANTGAATAAISGLATIAIQRNGAALKGGEIDANQWYELVLSDAATAQLMKIGHLTGIFFNGDGFNLSASQALSVANRNKWHAINAASLTITLPALADIPNGSTYSFWAGSAFTLAGNGAETIKAAGITEANTLSVNAGEYLTVVKNTTEWWIIFRGNNLKGAATQTQMEAYTDNTVLVTPANLQWHPCVSKCWIKCDAAGNINGSHNVTSILDSGTGVVTVNIATDFSSTNYEIACTIAPSNNSQKAHVNSQATGNFSLAVYYDNAGTWTLLDPTTYYASCHGDQA